jgi:hypothetical protein
MVALLFGAIMKDLTGIRFGFVEVIRFDSYSDKGRHPLWLCRCDCCTEKTVRGSHLSQGLIISCGCKRKARLLSGVVNKTHGKSKTREALIWQGIRNRCFNHNNHAFSRYGGRGITVCDRWNSFENFLLDMGECPKGHSIERIDVDGNYEPLNCKWIPLSDQANNRRNTIYVNASGDKKPISIIAEECGVNRGSLYYYHVRKGFPVQFAIEKCREKVRPCNEKIKVFVQYEGREFYLAELAKYLGLNYDRFHRLYRRKKLPLVEAIKKSRH